MTPETRLKNKIMLYLSQHDYLVLRMNVGQFFTQNGTPIRTGLPKGTSDLLAIENGTGRAIFIECKVHPRKPTAEQVKFINCVRKKGCKAAVCYSIEDLENLLLQK